MEIHRFPVFFDVDGVVAMSDYLVRREIYDRFGVSMSHHDLVEYDSVRTIVAKKTGSRELGEQALAVWFEPELNARSAVWQGNLNVMNLFLRLPIFDVYAVTTRPPACTEATVKWFNKHSPKIISENRLHIRKTENISGDDHKINVATRFDISGIFFEDYHITALELATRTHHTVGLVTRPWNKNFSHSHIQRINNSHEMWLFAHFAALESRKKYFT